MLNCSYMRKIIVQEMLTVDGFFCGPKGEIDWHNVDAEFNDYAIAALDTFDTLLFGRVTYDLMANYWPTEAALGDDPIVAAKMNSLHKLVLSKSLEKLEWNNSSLMKEIDAEEIKKMKLEEGKDIAIFGSGKIVEQFAELGLIDEYRFFVAPIILGEGKTLFAGLKERKKLRLLSAQAFASGNVLERYAAV